VTLETVFVGPAPRIAVSVAGSGPLVLFLHGIRGNRRNWLPQIEVFSERFTAAAWDARGYGDSDDYDGPLQFDDFARDVLRVVDFLGTDKAHVVGLSMGSRIARNVALRYPGRLHTLTLVSTTPGFDALSADEVRRFVTERKTSTPETVRRLLGSRAPPGAFDELTESLSLLHEESYRKTLEASVAQDRGAPLEQIRVPTLVIAGDEDHVYPPALARDVARRIPGARLVMVEGAGHLVNLAQPERFNQLVLEFIMEKEAIS
jgi:3-oxoadipate enol-lactonase